MAIQDPVANAVFIEFNIPVGHNAVVSWRFHGSGGANKYRRVKILKQANAGGDYTPYDYTSCDNMDCAWGVKMLPGTQGSGSYPVNCKVYLSYQNAGCPGGGAEAAMPFVNPVPAGSAAKKDGVRHLWIYTSWVELGGDRFYTDIVIEIMSGSGGGGVNN